MRNKIEPVIHAMRKGLNEPAFFAHFENLMNKLNEHRKKKQTNQFKTQNFLRKERKSYFYNYRYSIRNHNAHNCASGRKNASTAQQDQKRNESQKPRRSN
jgi:hypothetical protein